MPIGWVQYRLTHAAVGLGRAACGRVPVPVPARPPRLASPAKLKSSRRVHLPGLPIGWRFIADVGERGDATRCRCRARTRASNCWLLCPRLVATSSALFFSHLRGFSTLIGCFCHLFLSSPWVYMILSASVPIVLTMHKCIDTNYHLGILTLAQLARGSLSIRVRGLDVRHVCLITFLI